MSRGRLGPAPRSDRGVRAAGHGTLECGADGLVRTTRGLPDRHGIGDRRVRDRGRSANGRWGPPRAALRGDHPASRRTAMTAHLCTIARLELTAAARLKWIRLLMAALALLASAAAYSAGAANELNG